MASMTWTDWAAFVQAAILLGTAVIVWRYTVETQRLRETAERQVAETQNQAWLMLVQAQVSAKSAQVAGYAGLAASTPSPGLLMESQAHLSRVTRELRVLEQKLKALEQKLAPTADRVVVEPKDS